MYLISVFLIKNNNYRTDVLSGKRTNILLKLKKRTRKS